MAHSTDWRTGAGNFETLPDGAESKKQGDDRIRELKVAIRERMTIGHIWADSSNNQEYDGLHAVQGGRWDVYKSDKVTSALQITDTKLIPGTGVDFYKPGGTSRLVSRRRAFAWMVGGVLQARDVGKQLTSGIPGLEVPLGFMPDGITLETATCVTFRCTVIVAPNGAASMDYIDVDLLRVGSGTNPAEGNFTSILSGPLRIARNVYRANTSTFLTGTLSQYDVLVPTIVAVASGTPPSGTASAGESLSCELIVEY